MNLHFAGFPLLITESEWIRKHWQEYRKIPITARTEQPKKAVPDLDLCCAGIFFLKTADVINRKRTG